MSYETNKYSEFFEFDEGYYPEINESSIKDPKNKWQATFPHTDIVALLSVFEKALARTVKKSIWLEGSYGTGKSRILWMMQNLLSCSENEFDAYFDMYDNLRNETDLRERLRTYRNGKIVTATRYATGDITSTQKLIFAVFESLTDSLRKDGYKFDGSKTLRGKIANWLESDSANLDMFRAKLQKAEYRMSATLARRSAEEIIERLKNPNAEVSQLVEEILKLGEKEGIRAFNINMRDLIDWIIEVLAENNLKAIVFFWDEFSKFFGNNRNNLDEFQRLAELTNIAPFYLVIATHESDSIAGIGDQAFHIISDRFTHKNITMPDNIAFELIGHALKIKDVAKAEWELISAALRERTSVPRKAVMDLVKINDEKILTDLLPIHPITAILLKNLATYFASNQRSVFNFIKNNDPNVEAFQDFIAKKSPEDGDLLTVDCLWNFFYESGKDEYGGNVGRMNLRQSVRTILDSFALNKEILNPDEQIVLKTILLFQAIDLEAHGEVELFKPTEKNIDLAFTGVSQLENGCAVNIANELVRKEILFRKPGKIPTFAVMALTGDFAEIERLKKSTAETVKTADLVDGAKLIETINLTASQRCRYNLFAVAVDNFTLKLNRLAAENVDYKINVAVCFARNDDEQNTIYNLIYGAISNPRYKKFVFINASSNLINREIFNRWIENSAHEKYWRGKDNDLADKMHFNAADCLKEWKSSFEAGSFVFYPSLKNEHDKRRKISCQTIAQISDELADNMRRLYPYSVDDAHITDTLFMSSPLKKFAEAGINQSEVPILKTDAIKTFLGNAWQMSDKYWVTYPDLNISRLKIELDDMIKNELEKNVRISFEDIVAFLIERGYMPLNIYAFLTGFLLKEYATDPYRYSAGVDGNQGGAMSVQKLAECISESIKQFVNPSKNFRPKYLEIMSRNQRKFMEFAEIVFNVNEDISVEQTAQKLRIKLRNLGYPLWCYADAADESHKEFLQLLTEIAHSKQSVSVSALSESAGQFLINNPSTLSYLKTFLTAKKGREIFSRFLQDFDDGIIFKLANQIGVTDVVTETQKRIASGDAIWLRDKNTAEEDLKKMVVDYQIIFASQKFGIDGNTFNACLMKWAEFCRFNLKIPAEIIGSYYPPIKEFFVIMKDVVLRGEIPQSKRKNFLQLLVDDYGLISTAISDPIKVLREKFSYQLNGLSDTEIKKVFTYMPNSSFTDSQSFFHKLLNEKANESRKGQLKNELLKLWRKVVGEKLPREWSKTARTPILALVPPSELSVARKVFETVMSNSPEEKDVRFAIDYLEKRPSFFSALKDDMQIETAFRKIFIGKYRGLLDDNDEIRTELENKFIDDPYQWYPNIQVNEIVAKFAQYKYYSGGAVEKLKERITKMSDEEAKQLLLELLDKNFEVGLKLLRES